MKLLTPDEVSEILLNRKTKKPISEDLPSKDPVLEVIGSISDEIIFTGRDIDKELYGEIIHDTHFLNTGPGFELLPENF